MRDSQHRLLAAVLCVVVPPLAAAADEHAARLERLPPSSLLLQVPDGVTGDFAVAQEAPAVEFAFFPNQWEGARLWSSWGDALAASDGTFYASIGDHAAPHGTAYVYRIDPDENTVRLVVDYTKAVGVTDPEQYAPGKIHGALVEGRDGGIYFFGYRGSEGKTTADVGYRGDWLLRYDPQTGRTENLGIAVPHCSVPVLLYHAASHSLYGLAAPGKTAPDPRDRFFRFDLAQGKLLFQGGPEPNMARALILADDGRAWYSHTSTAGQNVLLRYDPRTNEIAETAARVPGDGQLRAASRPDRQGVVYGISKDGLLFAFDTQDESVRELVPAFTAGPLYTATCVLDPSGRYLYYVPGAHGRSHQSGTPVLQFDTRTGRRKVIAFLNALLRETKNYNLGGTYGIALSDDGGRLLINFNGAPLGAKQPDFGRCAVVVLHIPESERPID